MRIAREAGVPEDSITLTPITLYSGRTICFLALHAMETAAESPVWGAVILPDLNDQQAVIDLLDLPERTFPRSVW